MRPKIFNRALVGYGAAVVGIGATTSLLKQFGGRINPTTPRPGATPAAKPAAGGGAAGSGLPSADDDFHIERF